MKKILLLIAAVLVALGGMIWFLRPAPLTVAFISGTSGNLSELGVDGRNAFILRMEEYNEAGGYKGTPVEMKIYNDKNDPETLPDLYRTLDEENIEFVIGHMISALDKGLMSELSDDRLVLSPSISSALFDGIDDSFLRLTESYVIQAEMLSEHIYESDHTKKIAIVYDVRNEAYAKGMNDKLIELFEGEVVVSIPFGGDGITEADVVEKALDYGAEGIVMVTPANVTAGICQRIEMSEETLLKYSVSWSMTGDLFTKGGKSVEGTHFVYTEFQAPTAQYLSFQERFRKRFDYEATFISALTYEATSVFLEGLDRTDSPTPENVKAELVSHDFQGLNDVIRMDEYGDSHVPYMIYEAREGNFELIED